MDYLPKLVKIVNQQVHAFQIVIVVMACVLHDIGHVIHREGHEHLSLVLAPSLIEHLLEPIYDLRTRTILKGEILHAIYAHQREIAPLTIEAGVVKVADALDMESGRARIPATTALLPYF